MVQFEIWQTYVVLIQVHYSPYAFILCKGEVSVVQRVYITILSFTCISVNIGR